MPVTVMRNVNEQVGAAPPGLLADFVCDAVIAGVGSVMVFLPQILLLFFFIGLMEDCGYMARVAYLMDRVMNAGPTSKDKLVAALHSQGMLAETKTKYLLLFTLTLLEFNGTRTPIETRVKAIYDGFVQSLEKIIRTGKAAGEFRDDLDAREMAAVVMALQHGTLMEWYCRSATLDGPGLVRSARVVLLDGILKGIRKDGDT